MEVIDPVKFQKLCWPHVVLYKEQRQILYSLMENEETYVPAGNQLGKDFVSALAVLWFFCSRRPARVVTTSVKYDQLNDVLWGEIRNFINTSVVPLPLKYNHMNIRQIDNNGTFVDKAELVGQVVNKGEALLGRHIDRAHGIPHSMICFDEASGIGHEVYESSDTWAHCKLIIGNPYPCTNFFFQAVKEGDKPHPTRSGTLFRKVIRIKAEDSPNVRLALAQVARGEEPTREILVPGVIDYDTYMKRREVWPEVRQCIGLDAQFYEGADVKLYPPDWLAISVRLAVKYKQANRVRRPKAVGIDVAEGGDDTVWTAIDELGVIEQIAKKTPDTSIIPGDTIAFGRKHQVIPENWVFDRGGGGKQHADNLRRRGFRVRTVGFGEAATDPFRHRKGIKTAKQKTEMDETKYTYKNRRAEMYGILRFEYMDPTSEHGGFAIPPQLEELHRQLAPLPMLYDPEGRIYLPPKDKTNSNSTEITIKEMLGCSPDEADSLVLAVYGMHVKPNIQRAGAI